MASMQSWRKAYGAIKDTTTVSLANLNSDFKDLDVAIVKATNHVECPPKERHLRKVVAATSIARPRADVAYCIHALARRLAKTRNWIVSCMLEIFPPIVPVVYRICCLDYFSWEFFSHCSLFLSSLELVVLGAILVRFCLQHTKH